MGGAPMSKRGDGRVWEAGAIGKRDGIRGQNLPQAVGDLLTEEYPALGGTWVPGPQASGRCARDEVALV